jgi:hypothetical protein
METLFLIGGCAALGYALARLGFRLTSDGAFVALIRGYRALGPRDWPVGMQEEDFDRPWGKRFSPKSTSEREVRPPVVRVKPTVRVR